MQALIFSPSLLLLSSHKVVPDSSTPWTVDHQIPLSMGFPRQVYWSGLPFPPPEHLLNPGIEPTDSASTGGFFTTGPSEKTLSILTVLPFLGAHINSSRQYAAFDIHSCCCMYHWFILLSAESYSTGWLEQSAFFHFPGHLGYFQFGRLWIELLQTLVDGF